MLFGWWPPLGRPVALTLALSRRAGEGTLLFKRLGWVSRWRRCCGDVRGGLG